jgi:hypothetical protein
MGEGHGFGRFPLSAHPVSCYRGIYKEIEITLRWRVQPLMAALRRSSVAIVLATSAAPLPPQPHH